MKPSDQVKRTHQADLANTLLYRLLDSMFLMQRESQQISNLLSHVDKNIMHSYSAQTMLPLVDEYFKRYGMNAGFDFDTYVGEGHLLDTGNEDHYLSADQCIYISFKGIKISNTLEMVKKGCVEMCSNLNRNIKIIYSEKQKPKSFGDEVIILED